jgi:hypothetical protein
MVSNQTTETHKSIASYHHPLPMVSRPRDTDVVTEFETILGTGGIFLLATFIRAGDVLIFKPPRMRGGEDALSLVLLCA